MSDLPALARRALAITGWRAGMLTHEGYRLIRRPSGSGWKPVEWICADTSVGGGMRTLHLGGSHPDLNDGPTEGVIDAVLRERFGEDLEFHFEDLEDDGVRFIARTPMRYGHRTLVDGSVGADIKFARLAAKVAALEVPRG